MWGAVALLPHVVRVIARFKLCHNAETVLNPCKQIITRLFTSIHKNLIEFQTTLVVDSTRQKICYQILSPMGIQTLFLAQN